MSERARTRFQHTDMSNASIYKEELNVFGLWEATLWLSHWADACAHSAAISLPPICHSRSAFLSASPPQLAKSMKTPPLWIILDPCCLFSTKVKNCYSVWMNWRGIITHLVARSSLTSQLMRKQIIRGIQRNARRYNHLGLSGLSRSAWQHNWIGQLLCILTKRWCFTGELLAFVCDWKEGEKKKPYSEAECWVWLDKLWIGGEYSSWQTIQPNRLAIITQIKLGESFCF